MKRYTIGLVTGILLTTSGFMFMGATNNEDAGNGRYQMEADGKNSIYMIDTTDGNVFYYKIKGLSAKTPGGQWVRVTAQDPIK